MEFVDELYGFLEFGYSGADHQTVDRRARGAGLLDQPLATDL